MGEIDPNKGKKGLRIPFVGTFFRIFAVCTESIIPGLSIFFAILHLFRLFVDRFTHFYIFLVIFAVFWALDWIILTFSVF